MLIYNTASRKKETFKPIEDGKVKLYACGPTVYDYFHIGNARAFLVFDVVRRYFEWRGFDVTYVQNITDIEDKIIAQSIEENEDYARITNKYTEAFLQDCIALGIKPPHYQPRATEETDAIIKLIEALVQRGYAYEAQGDVYFDTTALPQYGSLSGKKIEEQMVGARVAENKNKKNPADFTLWKNSKTGEPYWHSPWGDGRPGWHSECVVMSQKYLGQTFDIHGGGNDLIFPHHENELAQALAISGRPLANYWMHNGFLNIEGEKMSKSLDNFYTARDILKKHSAEAIRFFFLSKHYRSPIDFNRGLIEESERAVKNFYDALKAIDYSSFVESEIEVTGIMLNTFEEEFIEAMDDDFNSARAISVLFGLTSIIKNQSLESSQRQQSAVLLVRLGGALGFFQHLTERLADKTPNLSKQLIEIILEYRKQARADKNWALSDKIRDDLALLSIEIKDTKDGCTWSIRD
ncbi:MAG: cysteine--tRNA ligase [Candidatus Cloacimonadaceae bacterium]|nr:cysteine--tRNA ligase [Candidatus Cloacimonadaceae bacterium]MDP3114617.1 cysteine--tRNA ligase [Candidatus Cloacimonadaceae bacterium]